MTAFKHLWLLVLLPFLLPPASATASKGLAPLLTGDRLITDQAGRRIEVTASKRRIISLYTAHTENLFALGLGDSIIGVTSHDTFPAAATSKAVFSSHDDPERLLAAKPDLVLIRPMIDRGHPDLIHRLEASGITVVSLQPRNINEVFTYWKILGTLGGRLQKAEKMIRAFKKAVAEFRKLTADVYQKPRVYFEAVHSRMKTFAPEAMAAYVLEAAGGVNVASDAPVRPNNNISFYGKERILSHARQIDVYLAQQGAMNPVSLADIIKEPGFGIIKAFADNKVYLVSEQIVSRPTCRLLVGINQIGTLLHPKIFKRHGPLILERFLNRVNLDRDWISL